MSKRKTISTRWRDWAIKEPFWAYAALSCFALSMVGLVVHLGVLSGLWRTVGLWMLIGFDVGTLGITFFRKQIWWFTFFLYVTLGVIGWEIASYFFGGQ
jgi:hypothetical protein